MRLSPHTLPTSEPLHLSEAKVHLSLVETIADAASYTDKDVEVSGCVSAARIVAERETWKALVLQILDLYLDEWPEGDEIELPYPPLREVVHVKYTDSDGTETTFTDYSVDTDSTPGRIVLNYEKLWPTDTLRPKNPIHIRFKAGYLVPFAANDSTDVITAANHPFADNDKVRLSNSGGALPAGLSALTDYYVISTSGDTFQLSTSEGGSAVNITDTGSGSSFVGVVPETTIQGMKLVIADFFDERADTVIGRTSSALPQTLPRAATHLFAMDTAKKF